MLRDHSHHHPVRLQAVFDSHALFEKFRVGQYLQVEFVKTTLVEPCLDTLPQQGAGAYRHGGFDHDVAGMVDTGSDAIDGAQHLRQVSTAVIGRRSTHCDKAEFGALEPFRYLCGERKTACIAVLSDEIFQSRLINGRDAAFKRGNSLFVDIDAADLVALFRKTGAGHKSHVTGADYANSHTLKHLSP